MISDAELRQLTEGPIENRTIAISGYRTVEMAKELLLLRSECRAARLAIDNCKFRLQIGDIGEDFSDFYFAARAETDSAGVKL